MAQMGTCKHEAVPTWVTTASAGDGHPWSHGNWGRQGRARVTVIARRSTAVTITTSPRQRMTQMQGDESGHRATGGREAERKQKNRGGGRNPQMLGSPQVEDIMVPDKNMVCGQAEGKLGVLEH